jgi:hypothetical protein
MKRKLNHFYPPNYATEKTGLGISGPSIPLDALDVDELTYLCDQFRRDTFKKAGKVDPNPPPNNYL